MATSNESWQTIRAAYHRMIRFDCYRTVSIEVDTARLGSGRKVNWRRAGAVWVTAGAAARRR